MPTQPNYQIQEFDSAGGTWSISLSPSTAPCHDYYIFSSGTITLAASWSVAPSGTPYDGMKCAFYYSAKCNLDGNTITIFGASLTQQQALSDCFIITRYDADVADWVTQVFVSDNDLPQAYDGVNTFPLTNAGGTQTLVAGIDKKFQHITGSGITLLGSWVWTFGGSPIEGDEFVIHYNADTINLNGNNITIGGNILTQLQANAGNTIVFCVYDGSSWICTAVDGAGGTDSFRVMGSSSDTSPDFLDGKVKNSVEVDSNKLQLVGDDASPDNYSLYGVDGSGNRGFQAQPKVYKAYLTQTGTNDPTATVVYNTVGNIVWTRDSMGAYIGTLAGAFTPLKTFIFVIGSGVLGDATTRCQGFESTINNVGINTEISATAADGVLYKAQIVIEVYP